MESLKIRKDILEAGLAVPVGNTYYSNSDPLPARSAPDNEDETEVYYDGAWQRVENIDWE